MNEDQVAHAAQVADEMYRRLLGKYEKGAIEHGTLIWEYTPLDLAYMSLDEAIDQCVYILTLIKRLEEGWHPTDMPDNFKVQQ